MKHKVVILEFDPTWQQKIDSEIYFDTKEAAETYIASYNEINSTNKAEGYLLASYGGEVNSTEKIST
jgi:hypothetical protein